MMYFKGFCQLKRLWPLALILVISSCTASCGCTVPQWPREPIAPGKSGEIKVVFNSAGKGGLVSKDITILANTNPVKTVLQIKVDIDKK